MDGANVVVVGGCGFIGQTLCRKLLDSGARVSVIDDLSSGKLEYLPVEATFYHCDIFRADRLPRDVLLEADYVFNLAAQFANALSIEAPVSACMTDAIGVLNILEVLKTSKTLKKYIYTSSSCVYGNSIGYMSEQDELNQTDTPYAIHKFLGEMYSDFYSSYYGFQAISIRVFNTYGPYEVAGPYRNVTPRFVENALAGEPLVVFGDGSETRDYTYVEDTADLLISAAHKSQDISHLCVNGGTGEPTSTLKLAESVLALTNSKSEIIYQERRTWDHVKDRVSDTRKANEELCHKPKVSLNDGLALTINWYRQHLGL